MLAVAEEMSDKCGLLRNDSDCGVYAFETLKGGQISLTSVRPVNSNGSFLPSNLMPYPDGDRLMPYNGEIFTLPKG